MTSAAWVKQSGLFLQMNDNLVSVIMPVFTAEKYVDEAIESVLSQTYRNIEVICINDKSTDNSLAVLKSFGNKIILVENDDNCGTAESRNKGIRIARGEFLAFIDNDDIWEKNKLDVQIDRFMDNAKLDVSLTYMQSFISPDLKENDKYLRYCPPNPLPGYIPSTILVKRTSFEKAGYFNSRWKNGESVDWLFKAREAGLTFEVINQVLVRRRIHKTNKSILDSQLSKSEYLKIIRESLNRRKASSALKQT